MSILKEYPKINCYMPRLLRTHKGVNYQNFIYKNRDHLLYLTRMDLLRNIDFANTDEALHIIENYKEILKILEEEDKEQQREEPQIEEPQREEYQELEEILLKEEKEEERFAQRCFELSHGMKY